MRPCAPVPDKTRPDKIGVIDLFRAEFRPHRKPIPMKRNLLFASLLAAFVLTAAVFTSSVAFADTAVRPVPVPDLSKLAPTAAKALTEQRAEIEKVQAGLVGPPLAQTYADIGALYARNNLDEAAAVAFYNATQIVPSDG